ncbi:type I polyketide synthase [Allokutzneria albata]|uniref:Ketoacyl-synthetase C-terminal extension n=1 Tax=Allokutzneria albata TaxID=211114 RepID=A0A1G9U9C9_ALLAB|nr:polyketide synthase [Allokutzneria albata]SDM56551.1 Ketoacyl-synthetase C-terminal extension [Allokutzneria albata]
MTGEIAIIGIGCRFPGAEGPDELWELLRDKADTVTAIPPERWDPAEHDDEDTVSPRWGSFLDDVGAFDAEFFGIRPPEAAQMDPQHRVLLEVTWSALEDAGIRPQDLRGSLTAAYFGFLGQDYALAEAGDRAGVGPWYLMNGVDPSFGPGRVAYQLGLEGPAVAVGTACSSSLVAISQACHSLRAGEADLAVAGGVSLILSPEIYLFLNKVGAIAGDGRCKTFDARADGFVRGEGCGVVVLKRLADALADRDDVVAVIRGSGVGHDGFSAGLTVPSAQAQQRLIERVLAWAQVDPAAVGYVEAHGTGTPLGDPIEMAALLGALGPGRDTPLHVGSVKTNIGHTDAAAGVAGLIKAALALRHGEIPANLHFREPNPLIPWERAPVRVPTEATPWPRGSVPRYAGVSAFGLSGTNAHVVLAEAPAQPGANAAT